MILHWRIPSFHSSLYNFIETLLLSYVLSGLQDESEDIQTMSFDAIEKIGKMHEADEYNDLKKTLFYQQQAEEIALLHLCGDEEDEFILPFPFKSYVLH